MLVGALLPFLFWFLGRWYPKHRWLQHIHTPLTLVMGTYWYAVPAATIFTWLCVGLLASFFLHRWWNSRYLLLFSAGMSIGALTARIFIYFVLINRGITMPENWWGLGGLTGDGCPLAGVSINVTTLTYV
jgi:hypothetical protein